MPMQQNMSDVFYKELIILDEFNNHFDTAGLSPEEKLALLKELEEMLHAKTLDFILEELPPEHHEEFMILLSETPQDLSHWDYLHGKVPGLKDKIAVRLLEFKRDLLSELL